MKLKLMATLAIATIFGLLNQTAEAATFNLSYTGLTERTLLARVEGTLQADGNTVFVSGISDVTIDGTPALYPLTVIMSFAARFGVADPATAATLTLDGSYLDIFAANNSQTQGFLMFAGVAPYGSGVSSSPAFGLGDGPFQIDDYKLTAVSAVPLPAGGLLLLSGLGLLALRRKR